MPKVAVATTSSLAADAAAEIADAGGNAVDCALAAALLSINTQPGVCALAGSAYVTVWLPGGNPVTIDGNVAVPGLGLPADYENDSADSVTMDYGAGITTLAGSGSVAVPGTVAAFEQCARHYGSVPWRPLFEPSIRATRDGFPLSGASHYYLQYSGDCIFGRSADGHRALHDDDGKLLPQGSEIHLRGLADSLESIALEGAALLYEGELAHAIVDHVRERGGPLTLEDLRSYKALERPCLTTEIGRWKMATNPAPAVGGTVLTAMIDAFGREDLGKWGADEIGRLIEVQRCCLDYRQRKLDLADDRYKASAEMIALAMSGELLSTWTSGSTVHTSAVDDSGLMCSITASSGYGAGEIPDGTGLWLNNCLGELELNRRGLSAGPPGDRLPSNMTPTVALSDNGAMSIGTPGADRITTALHQFLIHALQRGLSVEAAIAEPRVHVDTSGEAPRLMSEPGLAIPPTDLPHKAFDSLNMYFGGVVAVSVDTGGRFEVGADQRREGGIFITGGL